MRVVLVLTFDVPEPEAVAEIVRAMDPPKLPHFADELRLVVDPHAAQLLTWLDET